MGQAEGVSAVEAYPARWLRVLLWCPREVTRERCTSRGSKDVETRLAVWDETRRDLLAHADLRWSLLLETDRVEPDASAKAIDAQAVSDTVEATYDVRQVLG
ncbi:hypothetical protein [Streptomyces sp. AA1529]|uniref:hypothetical protein n=1 Tax=Streptomyces sp. AA1529 TaxID=1203257 RepID=UPI0002D2F10A|nr:hypothetical protein [Streptomyces sp. AA1529]